MSAEKAAAHSPGDAITLVTLIAIQFVGIAVIAGWHLHVRALVQVVPGIIPMQYNTALCFLVLGASAWALVAQRGRPILPAAGGALITIMGGLVLFEYATGISLGIDTAFFTPWERTLSADPGRIALTTAVSFVGAGGALALLALRPRLLGPFAIAHAFPLSFGLASLLGYMLGITYVLPFRLGSQMAIHTAGAFTAYGGVMIGYAWRRASHTDEELPRWSPVMASLALPVLFIAFSNTIGAVGQGIAALIGASLLGLAIHKLKGARIVHKGLILISIPLVFTLGFVALVIQMKHSSRQAQTWYVHSKEVIAQAQALSSSLPAESGEVAGDKVREAARRLQTLARDNPVQWARAVRLAQLASQETAFLSETGRLRSGGQEQAHAPARSEAGNRLMEAFQREMAAFLQEEERLDLARQRMVERSRERFNWLPATGLATGLLLTLLVTFLFSSGISARMLTLMENVRRLETREALAPPLRGTDEIARLDEAFHHMAASLDAAARKERAITEHAQDVICTIDAAGRFVYVSPACFKLWGYRAEELVGRRYIELVAPEDVADTNQAALEIMSGHALTDFENRYRRKDGSLVNIMWSAAWSETDGLMFAVAHNITERRAAEAALQRAHDDLERRVQERTAALAAANTVLQLEIIERQRAEIERQRLAAIVDSSDDAIIGKSLDSLITSWNKGAERLFGYTAEEVLGKPKTLLFPPERIGEDDESMVRLRRGEHIEHFESVRVHKDGRHIDVSLTISPIKDSDGNIVGASTIARDITQMKQYTQELARSNAELEQFAYVASHDLQEPLRMVTSYTQLLARRYKDKLDAEADEFIGFAVDGAARMQRLINDLLAYSRIGTQGKALQPTDLQEVLETVLTNLKTALSESEAQVTHEALPTILGDAGQLVSLFQNLLSNALKYRGETPPEVHVSAQRQGEQWLFCVRDNGIGIEAQYAQRIFVIFQRLHSKQEYSGTGIGLALCKKIVERHGGRIWVESALGKGAAFYFTVPVLRPEEPEEPEEPKRESCRA